MGSRVEILNDGGFRSDGRRQYELRSITIDLTPQGSADGSALITQGLTQVLVNVFGPREAKMRSQTIHDRANVNVEVAVAPFSTGERRRRGKGDRRLLDFAATIKSTFEPIILTHLYPRSQIDIYIQILTQDGSLLPACINGTTLALITASVPLLDFCCAVSCGVHSTSPLLDLTNLEENDVPNVSVAVMPKSGKVALVTLDTRLHVDRFEELVMLAGEAGKVLHGEMKEAAKRRTSSLVEAMGSGLRGGPGGGDKEVEDQMMTDF